MAQDDEDENEGSGTAPLELAKSYLAYASRALRLHRVLAIIVSLLLVAMTVVAVIVWPRSYTCVTVLSAQDSRVLDGDKNGGSLSGAREIVTSNENVAAIVDELKLTKTWETSLPPLSRFKQTVMKAIRGDVPESAKREALISMVQSNLSVTPPGWNESKLIISADWTDAKTAAAIADAADQSFLRARHVAEISTITEYITILEGHADELRNEIKQMAVQGKTDAKPDAKAPVAAAAPATSAAPAAVVTRPAVRAPTVTEEDLSELRSTLTEKQSALKAIEDAKSRRVAEAEQILTELRGKFTSAHPMVITAERNLQNAAQDSEQTIALRSEVKDLSAKLKAKTAIQREESEFRGGRVAAATQGATPGASSVEPLPAEIMRLMQEDNEDLDPAVSAQFRTAVNKYATLRDKIGSARVDLDTAQAAFKHRYSIVIPAEPPNKPSKPKVPVVLGGGLVFSLVLGLLAAVIAELRTGKLVERWQVDSLGVPLLGDVRWPTPRG